MCGAPNRIVRQINVQQGIFLMTTIVVTHEDNEIDEFAFDNVDQVISIGRRMTNDVCIPNLSVSGMHARLTIDDGSALIEDNNSTNGTYVNGRLISRQLLNHDDEVVIGKARLTVYLESAENYSTASQDSARNSQTNFEEDDYVENEVENEFIDEPRVAEAPPVLSAADDRSTPHDFLDDSLDQNARLELAQDLNIEDADDSYVGSPGRMAAHAVINGASDEPFDDHPMSLSEKAKLALGRERDNPNGRSTGRKVATAAVASSAAAAANRAFATSDHDTAVAEAPAQVTTAPELEQEEVHPLDGLDEAVSHHVAEPAQKAPSAEKTVSKPDSQSAGVSRPAGAVIEIQNGAKSGQVLPIDKPVTTLGRPGIQIAAIMRKPDGYFLMHIESDDTIDMPTLNRDAIGDEPVLLHSGDRLNVAGIDVEFMLS